mmetsp:Transcript_2393/g.5086  ORF Transcript_2393/g.5086 Transcript_2393/m.5086 type:complete len:484 (+) Transcript_2393:70-1521(+)
MVRKQDLRNAESQLTDLRRGADARSDEVTRSKLTLDGRKAVLAEKQRVKAKAAARKSELAQAHEKLQGELAQRREQESALKAELAGCLALLGNEKASFEAAQQVQQGIVQARQAVKDVRQELESLSSEAAKEAALVAAGDDLPEEIAQTVSVPQLVTLPTHLPDEAVELLSLKERELLEQAKESRAVLAALLRSLTGHSQQLREGLKQWGFARHMNIHTEGLIQKLEATGEESARELSRLQEERQALDGECKVLLSSKEAASRDAKELNSRHETGKLTLNNVDETYGKMQDSFRRQKATLEEAKRLHERLTLQHSELERELAAKSNELQGYPAEAAKRSSAASKLAENMQAQAQKVVGELNLVQQEFISLQQAHATLRQAHATVQIELEDERQAYQDLRDSHDMLNRELSALAKHYTEALAALVPSGSFGMEASVTLSGSAHELSVNPASRSPPAGFRSPLAGRSPTHALTAEGRLVTATGGP